MAWIAAFRGLVAGAPIQAWWRWARDVRAFTVSASKPRGTVTPVTMTESISCHSVVTLNNCSKRSSNNYIFHICLSKFWFSLVGARGVDAYSLILAYRGCGSTFICVIKAPRTCVARWTGTCVAAARQRATRSAVGAGTGQTAVFLLTPQPWKWRERRGDECYSAVTITYSCKHVCRIMAWTLEENTFAAKTLLITCCVLSCDICFPKLHICLIVIFE